MFIVDTIINGITTVIDKVVPDANVREQIKAQLATQAFEWIKLETADRESARRREVDTKDPTTRELAYIYTIGYFGILVTLMSGLFTITSDMHGLMEVLMGVLTAGQYSVMAYYFGSSHGSAAKDNTLSAIVQNQR